MGRYFIFGIMVVLASVVDFLGTGGANVKDFTFFLVNNYQTILTQFCYVSGILIGVGTTISKFTPTKKDDQVVSDLREKWDSMVQWLPSIGVTTPTKELKARMNRLEKGYKTLKE